MPTPLTPHSPVGAWTSFSLGTAGLAIQIESLDPQPNADLLVVLHRNGATRALPFVQDTAAYPAWSFLPPSALSRTFTPCIDEFSAAGITLRIFTPHAALPNPKRSGNLQYATAPGILLEVSIDNSASDAPATAFVGVRSHAAGRLRPLDWSSKTLCGVANGGRWISAAAPVKDEIATLQSDDLGDLSPRIEPAASAGGIVIRVPARTMKTVPLAFAAYTQGLVTQGIDARYFYASYFPRGETVANFLLQNAQRVRESCISFDTPHHRRMCGSAQAGGLLPCHPRLRCHHAGGRSRHACRTRGLFRYHRARRPAQRPRSCCRSSALGTLPQPLGHPQYLRPSHHRVCVSRQAALSRRCGFVQRAARRRHDLRP